MAILGFQEKEKNSVQIKGISIDSRTVKKGTLFFALKGKHFDGHDFVEEAFQREACGSVVKHEWISHYRRDQGQILIGVDDPLRALQDVASHYRQKFDVPVVAITGTNGKTTTKEMIASVLEMQFNVMKSPGNFNNHIGLALSLCDWNRNGDIGVIEMGTNHFGEIRRLCEIAKPTHGIVTNVGKGHLEFFRDIEGVSKAKAELLEYLKDSGTVFLNGDDPHLYRLKRMVDKTITYGFSDQCDLKAVDLGMSESGFPSMRVDEQIVEIPIPGQYNLFNALAAVAVGRTFGISWENIRKALGQFKPVEKRMEMIKLQGIVVLDDTYNANPSSVKQALTLLESMKQAKRKISVLGDMLELGKSSKHEHRCIGEWVAKLRLDAFYSFGPEMKTAAESAQLEGLDNVKHFDSKADLIREMGNSLKDGDLVLVKGSRGMQMEEIVDELKVRFQEEYLE